MGYVLDPERLHAISKAGIGLAGDEMFDAVTRALCEEWPGVINGRPRNWIFNNAGGAMGQITLLYASLSEYLLFFGSPIGTEGHSGRYRTHVYDFMLSGEMWCYLEGQTERRVYRPGDAAHLGPQAVKGYRLPEGAWMLEYARGPIPGMLPFGLADSLFSTLDLRCIGRTVLDYGRHVGRSMLRGRV